MGNAHSHETSENSVDEIKATRKRMFQVFNSMILKRIALERHASVAHVSAENANLDDVTEMLTSSQLIEKLALGTDVELHLNGNRLRRFINLSRVDQVELEHLQALFRHTIKLILSQNMLVEFPGQVLVWAKEKLSSLDLTNNPNLQSIPDELWNCLKLTSLGLSNCGLIRLNPGIGNLIGLTRLGLFGNGLKDLPPELLSLKNLQKLDLSNNLLTELPDNFGDLSSLDWLNVSNNRLVSLPCSIGNLVKLQELGLGGNQLTSIPVELSKCINLALLTAYDNQLTFFPDEISTLLGLVKLDLSTNQLMRISSAFFLMPSLTHLNLARNRLRIIEECNPPPPLERRVMDYVDISTNSLTVLPSNIVQLRCIMQLRGQDNPWNTIGYVNKWMIDGKSEMQSLATMTANMLISTKLSNVPYRVIQGFQDSTKFMCAKCCRSYYPKFFNQLHHVPSGYVTLRFARIFNANGGLTLQQLPLKLDIMDDGRDNYFPIVAGHCSYDCAYN